MQPHTSVPHPTPPPRWFLTSQLANTAAPPPRCVLHNRAPPRVCGRSEEDIGAHYRVVGGSVCHQPH